MVLRLSGCCYPGEGISFRLWYVAVKFLGSIPFMDMAHINLQMVGGF